jgi:hypothetical protein
VSGVAGEDQLASSQILSKHPNPLDKYKTIFSSILPGKTLLDIEPASPKEFQYKDSAGGATLPFSSLSSGEQEVVKVLFDVARKDIRHSVVIVDEPELHLHPTLTFRLIEALKSIGDHTNQFIFLTHSSDLISTYFGTGDVYFIDSTERTSNQAHRLSDLNTHHVDVAALIGDNLGLIAVGKKLVFVEGENSSIDRLTYHKISQVVNTEIRVLPVGSVHNIMTLSKIEEQIRQSIFGIDLFMIRDRDGLSDDQVSKLELNGRVRCLGRRHIENYFLDEDVLLEVAERLYLTEKNPLLNLEYIRAETFRIAEESISFTLHKNINEHLTLNYFVNPPSIKNLNTKTLDEVKLEISNGIVQNICELSTQLTEDSMRELVDREEQALRSMLADGSWRFYFQGKYIFSKICSSVLREDKLRVRHAYVDVALSSNSSVFDDIKDIFSEF